MLSCSIMEFTLISNEEKIFEGTVTEITCYSDNGPFVIMDNHLPYISKIKQSISFSPADEPIQTHNLKEGFIYTNGNLCIAVIDC